MDLDPFHRSPALRRRVGGRGERPFRSLRILVVDDEAVLREVLSFFFKAEGHEVETAPNGVVALQKFGQGRWDAVITDRAMPEMPGDELAAEIKNRSPEIPVIMITGFVGPMDPVGEHARAIDLIVRKPFSLPGIMEAVETVCADAAARHG
jgi:CheY-like chemotaxis protein